MVQWGSGVGIHSGRWCRPAGTAAGARTAAASWRAARCHGSSRTCRRPAAADVQQTAVLERRAEHAARDSGVGRQHACTGCRQHPMTAAACAPCRGRQGTACSRPLSSRACLRASLRRCRGTSRTPFLRCRGSSCTAPPCCAAAGRKGRRGAVRHGEQGGCGAPAPPQAAPWRPGLPLTPTAPITDHPAPRPGCPWRRTGGRGGPPGACTWRGRPQRPAPAPDGSPCRPRHQSCRCWSRC